MRIVDSHFHWYPRSIFEHLSKRKGYPRTVPDGTNGYDYLRQETGAHYVINLWSTFFELEEELEHMDTFGHEIDLVCSIGPISVIFSEFEKEEGRDLALWWNEEQAKAQRKYAGQLWSSAAIPLVDTRTAIEVLDHSILKLGLMGVNLPSSIGVNPRIDAERLEPFYARVEELGVPLFLHPTDAVFDKLLDGYQGALHRGFGRVIEVSLAGMRLVLSGIMERHPNLKIFMSHMGGALPYQSGRIDKNAGKRSVGTSGVSITDLPHSPSVYLKRMYTDTVQPHVEGMKWGIEYFGVDHVMYGSDYPCWKPALALEYFAKIGLSAEDQEKIMNTNARRFFNLHNQTAVAAAE
jgi:aminocarboxymuconate-semialdehyde decarboxylase